jgi:hypothetical protein
MSKRKKGAETINDQEVVSRAQESSGGEDVGDPVPGPEVIAAQRAALAEDAEAARVRDVSLADEIKAAVRARGGEDLDVTAVADPVSLNPSNARQPLSKEPRPVTNMSVYGTRGEEWTTLEPTEYIPVDEEDITAELPQGSGEEIGEPIHESSNTGGEDIGEPVGEIVGEPVEESNEARDSGGEDIGDPISAPDVSDQENGDGVLSSGEAVAAGIAGAAGAEAMRAGIESAASAEAVPVATAPETTSTPEVSVSEPESRSSTPEISSTPEAGIPTPEAGTSTTETAPIATSETGTPKPKSDSKLPSASREISRLKKELPKTSKFIKQTGFFALLSPFAVFKAAKWVQKRVFFGLTWLKNEAADFYNQLIGKKETVFGETPKSNIELLKQYQDNLKNEKEAAKKKK